VAISRDQSKREAQRLQLALHVGNVVARPLRGGTPFLIAAFSAGSRTRPSPWAAARLALHLVKAREHVADGVVAHVAHVQTPDGYGNIDRQ
jgi:hypothetical protein